MSASAESTRKGIKPTSLRKIASELFIWGVSLAWILFLSWEVALHRGQIASHLINLLPWMLLLMIVDCFPLRGWQSSLFTFDHPVTTAAALVLMPVEAGLVCFLGSLDSRELHGEISLSKTVFNRSQTAAHVFAISWGIHHFITSPTASIYILPAALLALALGLLLNYLAITVAISLEHGYPIAHVIRRLNLGKSTDYVFTLLAGAFLGAMLAALYERIHPWALLAFAAPILLGRQVLVRSQMFIEARRALSLRERAFSELSQRIYEERSDERKLIAADLHDEVLQPLFKVTLMAQILKADLSTGRLLDLDQDLPELLNASEVAASALRQLIGDLRRSVLGRGGLSSGLSALIRSFREQTTISLDGDIQLVQAKAEAELVTYQIAKEALTNAVRHSKASTISVELAQDELGIHLTVSDDGIGFDPSTERAGHFGLQIMRERAASIHAQLFIDGDPGRGSSITLIVPGSDEDNAVHPASTS